MQADLAEGLEIQERELLALLAERLRAGFVNYGALNVDRSRKNFQHEALEELLDAIVYIAMELMRRLRSDSPYARSIEQVRELRERIVPGVQQDAPTGNSGLDSGGTAENPTAPAAPDGSAGELLPGLRWALKDLGEWLPGSPDEEMENVMTKSYPIEIILSLTTGRLLKEHGFGDMHELAEHVSGHPIWTHEFAERSLWSRLSETVFAQHPTLRDAETFDADAAKASLDAYLAGYVERARARFGMALDIVAGTGERTEDPLTSASRLMPGKPILGVVV